MKLTDEDPPQPSGEEGEAPATPPPPPPEEIALKTKDASDLVIYRRGLAAYTSPSGFRVVVLRLGADPEKDVPAKLAAERRRYTAKDWRREFEGAWDTPFGDPFFPDFTVNGGREKYVANVTRLVPGPVIRAFDTGIRRPVCVWMQPSKSLRVWLIREFMPHDLRIEGFLGAVRYLSGEIPQSEVPPDGWRWVEIYANKVSGAHCPPPWFPPDTKFANICGGEALQRDWAAQSEASTIADMFSAGGVPLAIVNPRVKARNRLVNSLLALRGDGWPGMLLDPQCEESIEGFDGAFSYPKRTEARPIPDAPKDDGHYINLLDAIGYGVAAIVSPFPEEEAERVLMGVMDGGRTEVYGDRAEVIGGGWEYA